MSLVQAVITENFILVGADNRGIKPNGHILENCNKLIKLNKNVIFGCTGGILDNFKLFEGYCYYSDEFGLYNRSDNFSITYNEFVNSISSRFNIMVNEQRSKNSINKYDIGSMICGHNGEEFEVTTISLGAKYNDSGGIIKTTKARNFPYKGINAGKTIHMENLHSLVYQYYIKYGKLTMLQYKNIMHEVFENGEKFDSTINSNIHFESIKKKDVIE